MRARTLAGFNAEHLLRLEQAGETLQACRSRSSAGVRLYLGVLAGTREKAANVQTERCHEAGFLTSCAASFFFFKVLPVNKFPAASGAF